MEELLGAEIQRDIDKNEIAEQLSRINEQLVIKNRRWGRFWKIVGIVLLIGFVLSIVCFGVFSTNTSSGSTVEVEEMVIDEELEK